MKRKRSIWGALVLGLCLLQPLAGHAGGLVWKSGTNEAPQLPGGQGWAAGLQPLWVALGRP